MKIEKNSSISRILKILEACCETGITNNNRIKIYKLISIQQNILLGEVDIVQDINFVELFFRVI